MSLIRWSSSPGYIYEPVGDDKCLTIECHGYFSLEELKNTNKVIEQVAAGCDYSKRDLLELKLYIKNWVEVQTGAIKFPQYVTRLTQLRRISEMNYYLKYKYFPSEFHSISYKEKMLVAENYSKRKIQRNPELKDKQKLVEKVAGYNDLTEITILDDKHYSFRNKKMHLETKKMTRRVRCLYYEEPLIVGATYLMTKDQIIFNGGQKNNPKYKELKAEHINNLINKLRESL
jgi:hypothetical protein